MIYIQQQAHQDLRDLVRCYWKVENDKIQFRLLAIEHFNLDSIATMINDLKSLDFSYLDLNKFKKDEISFFEYMNNSLFTICRKEESIDPRKRMLLRSIDQTKGNKSVEFYSQTASWSRRQINRYFQSTFGMSLKSYCSIRKCASTYSQIKNGQLNPKQGYFDQPHFIKEIKKIAGYTPKVLLKNENDRFLQFSIIKSMQIIKLKSNLPEEELQKRAKERESRFKSIPGLLQKYYVKTGSPGEYGGVYVWDSPESLQSYQASDLAKGIPEAYAITEAPHVEMMDIIFKLRD